MRFDGIIFDMDGVIVDVSRSYREAIRQTASYFLGREVRTEEVSKVKNQVGMNNDWDATFALIGNAQFSYEEIKAYFQSIYWGNSKKKGLINKEKLLITKDQLIKLKEKYKKMGIATGRPGEEANYVIINNRLEGIFDCLVALEDVKRAKPFPDCINKVIKILKLKKAVYIGDSPDDVLAAKSARIPSIYIGDKKIGTIRFPSILKVMEYLL